MQIQWTLLLRTWIVWIIVWIYSQAVCEAAILKGHMFPPLCMVLFRFPLILAIKSHLTFDLGNWDNTEGTLCARKNTHILATPDELTMTMVMTMTLTLWHAGTRPWPCVTFCRLSDFSVHLQVKGSQLELMALWILDQWYLPKQFFGI